MISLKRAGQVPREERDYNLALHGPWPPPVPPPGWTEAADGKGRQYLHRVVSWERPTDENDRDFPTFEALGVPMVQFDEALLRFPSAPVYHTHRKQSYLFPLGNRVNYHTLRLIRPIRDGNPSTKIERIYVLHNGLNEIDEMLFHYRMAAILTHWDDKAACILRPFPGHLMRHPIGGPESERPLDRYLLDPGDLFRQFLRYMIETQWLFSVLAPHEDYRVVDGLGLLAVRKRADSAALSGAISDRWSKAYSILNDGDTRTLEESNGTPVDRGDIENIVGLLRSLIDFEPYSGHPDEPPPPKGARLAPILHTVGYSLGGFLAQAIFFTWPFAVGSCTTICSGGALRDVALTAFAHPEEWQTVIHAIRYELETSMVENRIKFTGPGTRNEVCGIDVDEFSCFYQMFHDVFVREFGGSYRSRVSEFVSRLLFVIGGRDPIISASSVLDASPPEGINLVQVSNLPHSPERGDVHWQAFWLPEATRLLSHFAVRSERLLRENLSRYWWNEHRTGLVPRCNPSAGGISVFRERPSARGQFDPGTGDDALNNEALQVELQAIADRFAGKTEDDPGEGWLFIVRNEVPAALLGDLVLHLRGKSLHHSEEMIWSYFDCLRTREAQLRRASGRLTLVIPKPWGDVFVQPQALFSPRPEAFMFRIPSEATLRDIRRAFYSTWGKSDALRHFRPETGVDPPIANTLPDVWIWWSPMALGELAGQKGRRPRQANEEAVVDYVKRLRGVPPERRSRDDDWKQFYAWLLADDVRIVRISRAEFNPRFRGWRVRDPGRAWTFLRRAVGAYSSSEPSSADPVRLAEYLAPWSR